MNRRNVTLLTGAALAAPRHAIAQQGGRMRRIGVLMAYADDDPEARRRLAAFLQGLERSGWVEGRNVRVDLRFTRDNTEQADAFAKELVALQPDVIVAWSRLATAAAQRQTRTIPIVFMGISDPISFGFISSLARPGGNITGFLLYEPSVVGKWLAMLKEIAPGLKRAALMINPAATTYAYYLPAAKAMAETLAIELIPSPVESAADIQRVMASIASVPNSGLVVPPDSTTTLHRELIAALAAGYRLPAVYSARANVAAGGLMSYGTDLYDQARQGASYVDRILRGAKPADLPAQTPVKYETILNLKTAKALGLDVPPGLLVAADEVIE
jgi:putative tryptophan/tyrosine transport system substrate-binding protein